MPTFIATLPVHALVVHAVVVLVPLAVLTGIVVAVWPAARRRYGWPVAGLAVLATIAVPLATSSGEDLERRLPADPLIETHARLGDELLVFVLPMAAAIVGLVLLDFYRDRTTRAEGVGATAAPAAGWLRPVAIVLAVVTVAAAVVSAVQVVRIGDAGARAVWHDTQYVPAHGGGDGE